MKKRLLVALILVFVLSFALATPVFAGPPPDAGKGTIWNEGLLNALERLMEVGHKTGFYGPAALIDYLSYVYAGPPPWFVGPPWWASGPK